MLTRGVSRRSTLKGIGGAVVSGALLDPRMAPAQSPPLVGVFTAMGQVSQATQEYAFLQGMRDLGYTEGLNVRYAFRYGEGIPANYPTLAQSLADLGPNVIVSSQAIGSVDGLRDIFRSVPVVCAAITSNLDLIRNDQRPEGNITGIRTPAVGDHERLALATELVPGRPVGILMGASDSAFDATYQEQVRAIGLDLGITLLFGRSASVETALEAYRFLVEQGVGVISYPTSTSQFNVRRAEIIELARVSRMPTVYDRRDAVWEGGLIGIGPNQRYGWRRAAYFVDRILRGALPAELPVEQSTEIDLAANLTAATEIGFVFPESILAKATERIT